MPRLGSPFCICLGLTGNLVIRCRSTGICLAPRIGALTNLCLTCLLSKEINSINITYDIYIYIEKLDTLAASFI